MTPMVADFYLYGRDTCHLCHDMWADMRLYLQQNALAATVEWVDIEDEPTLTARYGLRIPVLTDATGNVVCEGHWDAVQWINYGTNYFPVSNAR